MATERSIAGRYVLRHEIGRGGMGVVWCAEDSLLGREVALKRIGLSPGGASPDTARAAREARLAATVSHAHVVAVFDLVQHGDEQWLVMEHVEGSNLAQLVQRDGPLSPDQAARLLCQAADALSAAHLAGIVHRDVKPSNIIVTPEGRVKLTDFGIARGETDATLTATGLMTGSPAYIAPEVASGRSATSASDVWSLGATLYHALTGQPPYDVAGNVVGALYRIVHEDPPRPPSPGWLAPLFEATMAKDPAARWSMAEVAAFLKKGPAAAPDRAEPTRVLAPVAPALAPAPPATAWTPPDSPPAGPPSSVRASEGAPRRGAPWAWLVVAAALVAAALAGWWLLDTDGSRTPAGGSDDPSIAASPEPSSPEPTEEPTEEPSPETSPTPTAAGMEAFVADYLATVTEDHRAAWGSLTPAFQRASGGFSAYRAWWSQVETATLGTVSADPAASRVTYSVTYVMDDGRTTSEQVTLVLVMDGDRYLIAGEE